jgi:hypothetical protein
MIRWPAAFKPVVLQGLILVVIFFIFLPVIRCQFVSWDDDYHVYANRAVERLDAAHLKLMFLGHVKGTYVPLTFLSFAVEKHFFGLQPWIYHLDNLLLHLAIVGLIIHLGALLGLSLPARLMAALLFGIHPLHAESVIWVTERKDVLYSFFYLLALVSYCHYIRSNRRGAFVLSVGFGLLSVLAKPMALSLPLILGLLDWFFRRPCNRRVVLEKVPFLLLLPLTWISFSMIHVEMFRLSPQALLVFCWVFAFYIKKFIFPIDLSPLYTLPQPVSFLNPDYLVAVVILAGFVVAVIRFRHSRWFMFAVGYFLLSIFFLLRVSAETLGPLFVANHYMYLPSLGFCFLAGYLFDHYAKMPVGHPVLKYAIGLGIAGILLIFGVSTQRQILVWKDNAVFWDFMVAQNPTLALPYLNRGITLAHANRLEDALRDLNKAVELDPRSAEAFNDRGNIYAARGESPEAIANYTQAIALQKGSCADDSCDKPTVISSRMFREVPKHDADLANYYSNRGAAFLDQKNYPAAVTDLREAQRLNPYLREAFFNAGMAYAAQDNYAAALANLERAKRLGYPVAEDQLLRLKTLLKK